MIRPETRGGCVDLRLWMLLVGPAALGGCSPPDVSWVALGAGAAAWPSNSRAAVTAALEAGVPAIEVDVFVSGDRTPVLHATPYLNEDTCRTAENQPLEERVWLLQVTTEDLLENYRCGAAPDPDHPDAALASEPLLTLDAFADLLVGHPEVQVVVDVQQWANVSHPPAMTAAEVLERWWRADLANEVLWTTASADAASALLARGHANNRPVEVWLGWPHFPPRSAPWLVGLGRTVTSTLGLEDARAVASQVGVAGLVLPVALAEADAVEAAVSDGLGVAIGPVRTRAEHRAFGGWPVDYLMSPLPGGAE